jgi:hypothetical protein
MMSPTILQNYRHVISIKRLVQNIIHKNRPGPLALHVQMDELRRVILEAPKEKTPVPDGFIRIFFQPAGK